MGENEISDESSIHGHDYENDSESWEHKKNDSDYYFDSEYGDYVPVSQLYQTTITVNQNSTPTSTVENPVRSSSGVYCFEKFCKLIILASILVALYYSFRAILKSL